MQTMRTCRTCGESKGLMEFYRQSNGSLQRDCKECWKAYVKANRLLRIEQYTAYERSRANLPHRVAARAAYSKTEAGKEAHKRASRKHSKTPAAREAKRRYVEQNPIKRAAHVAVGNALRDGKLTRQP